MEALNLSQAKPDPFIDLRALIEVGLVTNHGAEIKLPGQAVVANAFASKIIKTDCQLANFINNDYRPRVFPSKVPEFSDHKDHY